MNLSRQYRQRAAQLGHLAAPRRERVDNLAEFLSEYLRPFTGWVSLGGMVLALLIVGLQALAWHLTDEWPPLTVIDGAVYLDIHEPIIDYVGQMTWQGDKKTIATVLLKSPLSGFVVLLGFVVGATLNVVFGLIVVTYHAITKVIDTPAQALPGRAIFRSQCVKGGVPVRVRPRRHASASGGGDAPTKLAFTVCLLGYGGSLHV